MVAPPARKHYLKIMVYENSNAVKHSRATQKLLQLSPTDPNFSRE